MESMNPTLRLLFVVREHLENGGSVRNGLRDFAQNDPSSLAWTLTSWLSARDRGQIFEFDAKQPPSERHLLRLLERGLHGEPIATALQDFEQEIIERCEIQIEEFVATLPLKSLLPLLLLIFPAYLILLVGPFLERLVSSLH